MVLAISIGNTNITWGVQRENGAILTVRRSACTFASPDDFMEVIPKVLDELHIKRDNVSEVVLASVNPGQTELLRGAVMELLDIEPIVVNADMKMRLDLSAYDTSLLGSDRIAICEAAAWNHGLPVVVFDFGTATTINVVNSTGCFLGGSILPGLTMSLRVLAKDTAQLPESGLSSQPPLIGRNTRDCINSGVIFGAASMLDGMAGRIETDLGQKITILATGGHAPYVLPYCQSEIVHDPELLMKGLFELCREQPKKELSSRG